MNRPILYGIFPLTVDGSGIGSLVIQDGIRAGAFVTCILAPAPIAGVEATYGYCVQSRSGANLFIKKDLTGDFAFSDLYAITSLGRFIIAGTPGDYSLEIWIYDDAKLG